MRKILLATFLICVFAQAGPLFLLTVFRAVTSIGFQELHSGGFNGSSAYVDMGNVSALNIDGHSAPFSVKVWFKGSSFSSFSQLVAKRSVPNAGMELGIDNTGLITTELVGTSGGADRVEATWGSAVSTGTWYMAAWTNSGAGTIAGTHLYLCSLGTCSSQTPTTLNNALADSTANTSAFVIGARSNASLPFNGLIDEVAYFNTELSSGTVTAMYNSGGPTDISALSGLVSWWRFESTAISPTDDSSTINDRVASNNGTNNGATFSTDVP